GDNHRPARYERDRRQDRVQQFVGGVGGVQVVVENPVGGVVARLRGVGGVRELARVRPQQVVQGIAARDVLGEQVGTDEFGQQRAYPLDRYRREAGRGGRGEVRPGVQPEQPEQPGRVGRQRLVRPGE